MADSIPKLRRIVNEQAERIRELEARPATVVVEKVVEKTVAVPGPVRYVDKPVPFEVEVVKWRDVVEKVQSPPEVITKVVEVESPVEVIKYVNIPGPERVIYQDNPDHLATIRALQEKLCQFTSQSDL